MIVAGSVLAAVAALVHGWIFRLESLVWTGAAARRVFGTSVEEARITAPLAFNQGFYNLFLAVDVLVGLVLLLGGARVAGLTAVLIGTGSMVAAGIVLVSSDRSRLRASLVQALVPAIAIVLLVVGVVTGG